MKHLIPTLLCSWILAASLAYKPKRPQIAPKPVPRCYQDFRPHFDWEDSVYARNRAYFKQKYHVED